MAETFFEALREIMSIQRWNFVPRVDEWSEAENIAYYTHLAFAISMNYGYSRSEIEKLLCRCLLKSFNKHLLSDIPIHSRDAIKKKSEKAWERIVDDAARKTAEFFPREIKDFIDEQMKFIFHEEKTEKPFFEEIIKFCQYQSAWEECEANARAFPIMKYNLLKKEIETKFKKLTDLDKFRRTYCDISQYSEAIRILKYVRRWNRLNRNLTSSVMAHSFIVAFLALFFSSLEKKGDSNFRYECIIRGLFHDVPESFTGDIITPVKEIINKENGELWGEVEATMLLDFKAMGPEIVQKEIDRLDLLRLSGKGQLESSMSLVKDCDKFALVLECAFEKRSGNQQKELLFAHLKYVDDLRNSEWPRVREYTGRILDEYPIEHRLT